MYASTYLHMQHRWSGCTCHWFVLLSCLQMRQLLASCCCQPHRKVVQYPLQDSRPSTQPQRMLAEPAVHTRCRCIWCCRNTATAALQARPAGVYISSSRCSR
jgi:hypothetical protein